MIAYLTGVRMPSEERDRVEQATDIDDDTFRRLLDGDFDAAMNAINARRRLQKAPECAPQEGPR